jgi:hypothetical protein
LRNKTDWRRFVSNPEARQTPRLMIVKFAHAARPGPCNADYKSAKDHSGDQCLANPIALPQTKHAGAPGNYAE